MNPRKEWDHGTTIYSRSKLIENETDYLFSYDGPDMLESKKELLFNIPMYAILPLYCAQGRYDYCSMSTEFEVSDQIGWIYITKDDFHQMYYSSITEFQQAHPGQSISDYCRDILKSHVETYEQYLNNEVYYYIIEDYEGDQVDSCSGWYGDDFDKSGIIKEAESVIDYYIKRDLEQRYKHLKKYIKGKVSFVYRNLPDINHLSRINV
jgi:hypothetical protein